MPPNESGPSRDDSERDLTASFSEETSTVATLLGNFYRGEVDRATSWRSRLDQTSNWAVVLVAAILTWAFSRPSNPHYVILIGMLGVTAFLLMEAHRFQEYDIWRRRVRLIQTTLFVELLDRRSIPDRDWQAELSESLSTPTFTMPFRKAVGHRLRRMYLALLLILLASWITQITVFRPREPWQQSASIPGLGGELVITIVGSFYVIVVAVTILSAQQSEIRKYRDEGVL